MPLYKTWKIVQLYEICIKLGKCVSVGLTLCNCYTFDFDYDFESQWHFDAQVILDNGVQAQDQI